MKHSVNVIKGEMDGIYYTNGSSNRLKEGDIFEVICPDGTEVTTVVVPGKDCKGCVFDTIEHYCALYINDRLPCRYTTNGEKIKFKSIDQVLEDL